MTGRMVDPSPGTPLEALHQVDRTGRVFVLVEHGGNQRRLVERLSGSYETLIPDEEPFLEATFDLCIVDERGFEDHRAELEQRKRAAAPVFLPVLLLRGARSDSDIPAPVWEIIDEVISLPTAPEELEQRIDNLLKRRGLSEALKRLQERSEERFRSLFQAAPDPVVVSNSTGEILRVNDAFIETFEVEGDQIVGTNLNELDVTPEDAIERVLLNIEERPGERSREVVEWRTGNDERLITELNADVVTELGEVTDRIGIFRDVTTLKEREEMLERQNERLNEFAGTIAHDLRNPLTIAQGYLDVARDTGDGQHFDSIESALDRIEQLVDEILTLARLGQAVLEPSPVDLEEAARTAWEHVPTGEVRLMVNAERSLMADENRLQELLENLFRNAIEHGAEVTTVRIGCLDPGGFFVEDDGQGIPEDDRNDVFKAGFTTSETGTGFGLSIVNQIVEGHDWTIKAVEGDAGGARFEITGLDTADR